MLECIKKGIARDFQNCLNDLDAQGPLTFSGTWAPKSANIFENFTIENKIENIIHRIIDYRMRRDYCGHLI